MLIRSRRQFLGLTGEIMLAALLPPLTHGFLTKLTDRYRDLKTKRFLGKIKVETRINDLQVFTEGPAVDRSGNVYFTNVPMEKILKWNPQSQVLSTFKTATGKANGLRMDLNGDMLICEGGTGRLTRLNIATGMLSILAEKFQGKNIQSPNDLDFDDQGRIYFSSRTETPDLNNQNKRAVYRIDPDGALHQILSEPDVQMPNGIAVSPDSKKLYLIEAHPDKSRPRNILVYDLDAQGSLSNRKTLIDFYPGRSGDGMCIDREGNLYVAAGLHRTRGTSETLATRPGIHVISPEGKLLAFRETPEDTITNCTFGGADLQTLYVTCGSYLLSIRTRFAGKPSYRPSL